MTMSVSTTKRIESVPWMKVLRTTASMASTFFAVPKLVSPRSSAALKAAVLRPVADRRAPSEKILYIDAVTVTTAAKVSGTSTTQSAPTRPRPATIARHTASAMAARSWFAMPNSGKSVLIPPSGSVTPMIRMAPQPATMIAVQIHAPARQEVSRKRGTTLPRLSCSMNRATRVPASTAVRMNSASNMIAKWYQKLIRPVPPMSCCMMCASPTASVGAPPVRETIDSSPTFVRGLREQVRGDVHARSGPAG